MVTVHIPISTLPAEVRDLFHRALRGEEVLFEGEHGSLRLNKVGPTVAEFLANEKLWAAANALDDRWTSDMEAILAERKLPERDPWA